MKSYLTRKAVKNLINLVLLTFLVYGCSSTNGIKSSKNSIIEGVWHETANSSCDANYHKVTVEDSFLNIQYIDRGYVSNEDKVGRQVFVYDILESFDNELKVRLKDETRKDSEGNEVIWFLKSIGSNQYCWRRDDWDKNDCTMPRYRCNPNNLPQSGALSRL
jgi:hypothetical protein